MLFLLLLVISIIINFYIISGVQYYTGQFFDIKRITAAAQKKVTMHVSLQLQATIFFCYFLSGIDKETLHNTKNAKFYYVAGSVSTKDDAKPLSGQDKLI